MTKGTIDYDKVGYKDGYEAKFIEKYAQLKGISHENS